MEQVFFTPRLKLSLLTKAEPGSQELAWIHKLRSNEQASFWSLRGASKSVQDSEAATKHFLPVPEQQESPPSYRVAYAVHKISASDADGDFIGIVNLKSLDENNLALPETHTFAASPDTLPTEVAYMFLPEAWGKGYATEAVGGVYEACRRGASFWKPFGKVHVRAIVNGENVASQRVMEKTGMVNRGVYEWNGDKIFVGGRWRESDELVIFGRYLLV